MDSIAHCGLRIVHPALPGFQIDEPVETINSQIGDGELPNSDQQIQECGPHRRGPNTELDLSPLDRSEHRRCTVSLAFIHFAMALIVDLPRFDESLRRLVDFGWGRL